MLNKYRKAVEFSDINKIEKSGRRKIGYLMNTDSINDYLSHLMDIPVIKLHKLEY